MKRNLYKSIKLGVVPMSLNDLDLLYAVQNLFESNILKYVAVVAMTYCQPVRCPNEI